MIKAVYFHRRIRFGTFVLRGSGHVKGKLRRLLAIIMVLIILSADICALAEAAVTLTLPSALQVIEKEAFFGNSSLDKVVVPNGTTEIRSRAFANSSLTELILPDTLTYIAEDAFEGCTDFSVQVPADCYARQWCIEHGLIVDPTSNYEYKIIDNAYAQITDYAGDEADVVVPGELGGYPVKSIGGWAFAFCRGIKTIDLPEGIETIGRYAFNECSALQAISIPDSVEVIHEYAFYGCKALVSVTLPDGIAEIANNTFNYCSSLTEIVIPDSVCSIGS